jgi:alkylated DNA repair dioxygenase AlkB
MDIKEYTLGEGKLIYIPNWADDPDALYREAKKLSFTPETVTMYTKTSIVERQTVDYGLFYPYNKTAKPSIEWEGIAIEVRKRLEAQLGIQLPQCACNQYGSPTAYIGAHRDKPTIINGEKVEPKYIASLSLGSARKMVFVPKEVGMQAPTIPLPPAAPQTRRRVKESKAADRWQALAESDSAELGFVPEPVGAAPPPITVTEAPTPTVKTTTLSLLPIFTADQPTELRKADMDVHRAHIKSLNPEEMLATTIVGFKLLDHATEIGDLYLAACQKLFDNRGQGNRIISGYNGFEDFVERGLGGHIRTIQRRLQKYYDPEGVALKAEEEKEKRRLAAAEQKQKAQADAELKPVIEGFEKRAARFEKDFNEGSITSTAWLDLLQDEKKRCDHPDWVTKLDTVITQAKAVIAAAPNIEEKESAVQEVELDRKARWFENEFRKLGMLNVLVVSTKEAGKFDLTYVSIDGNEIEQILQQCGVQSE